MTENEFARRNDRLISGSRFKRCFLALSVFVTATAVAAAQNVSQPQELIQLANAERAWKLNSSGSLTFGISQTFALAHIMSAINLNLERVKSIPAGRAPVETLPKAKNFVTTSDGPLTLQGTATTTFGANLTKQFSLPRNAIRLSDQSRVIGEVITNKALLREGSRLVHPPITSP